MNSDYLDVAVLAEKYKNSIDLLSRIRSLYPDGPSKPDKYIYRAKAVTMLSRPVDYMYSKINFSQNRTI